MLCKIFFSETEEVHICKQTNTRRYSRVIFENHADVTNNHLGQLIFCKNYCFIQQEKEKKHCTFIHNFTE